MPQLFDFRVTVDVEALPAPPNCVTAAEPILLDPVRGYLAATPGARVERLGPSEVVLAAEPGDTLRWFLSTGSNNFEQAALLESLEATGGDEVLASSGPQIVERSTVVPGASAPPSTATATRRFHFLQQAVAQAGSGHYDLVFSLYRPAAPGQPEQLGSYRWAIQLTVDSKRDVS
jgi:hypothetical protein